MGIVSTTLLLYLYPISSVFRLHVVATGSLISAIGHCFDTTPPLKTMAVAVRTRGLEDLEILKQ